MSNGDRTLIVVLFGVFVAITLIATGRISRRSGQSADTCYTGQQRLKGWQNGIAISGDQLSAASLLGFTGLIALHGYDSLAYPMAVIASYVLVLVLVAEPLRNLGRITIGDALAIRMGDRTVRALSAICGLVITLAYLISQVVGAGSLAHVLLGVNSNTAIILSMVIVGVLMLVYVLFGGMTGTTWVQIFKATLLMAGVIAVALLAAIHFGFTPAHLLNDLASRNSGQDLTRPGGLFGSKLDFLSFALGNVLGTAGLPHVMMRFFTVPDARAARQSASWAFGFISIIYVLILILGFGAAAAVGVDRITQDGPSGNSALPLLAQTVAGGAGSTGGSIMLAVVGALAFATILAVVAGLTISASSNVAHDLWSNVIRRERTGPNNEVLVGKAAAVVVTVVAVLAGIALRNLNVAFLASLGFTIAASTNVPVLLCTLYWRRFTARGAKAAMVVGLLSSLMLIMVSESFMGPAGVIAKGSEPIFPLQYVGIVSIPAAFLAGVIGSLTNGRVTSGHARRFDEQRLRMLLGATTDLGHGDSSPRGTSEVPPAAKSIVIK